MSRTTASALASSGVTIVTSARSAADGRLERVGQVAVARRDRQHLGLARGADDREGAVVELEGVLDRQADLQAVSPVSGRSNLNDWSLWGASLSAIASTSVPASPGLSAAWR